MRGNELTVSVAFTVRVSFSSFLCCVVFCFVVTVCAYTFVIDRVSFLFILTYILVVSSYLSGFHLLICCVRIGHRAVQYDPCAVECYPGVDRADFAGTCLSSFPFRNPFLVCHIPKPTDSTSILSPFLLAPHSCGGGPTRPA